MLACPTSVSSPSYLLYLDRDKPVRTHARIQNGGNDLISEYKGQDVCSTIITALLYTATSTR